MYLVAKYFLVLMICIPYVTRAQNPRAFVTYRISSKSTLKTEHCEGLYCCRGELSQFYSFSILHGSTSTGILVSDATKLPYTRQSADSVTLTNNMLNVRFQVSYRHYRWWCDNTDDPENPTPTRNKDDLAQISVTDKTATTNSKKVSFLNNEIPIPLNPDWYLYYNIESVSPFQPAIINDYNNKCAGSTFEIEVNTNTPSDFEELNTNNTFEWQYGQMETVLRKTQYFEYTQWAINNYLRIETEEYGDYINYRPDNINNICQFILNASYLWFKDHQQSQYQGSDHFAATMMEWLLGYEWNTKNDPYYLFLTDRDIRFLERYLYDAAQSAYKIQPCYPLTITDEVVWHTHPASTKTLSFLAEDFYRDLTNNITVYFRVRAKRNAEYGPWSVTQTRTVRPAPPNMEVEVLEESCPNYRTGKIKIKNITSPKSDRKYMYRIGSLSDECAVKDRIDETITVDIKDSTKCDWTELPQSFTGNELEVPSPIPAGSARIYLTYQDASIRNCFTPGRNVITVDVPALPELSIAAEKTDVRCEGETSGQIKVSIQQGGGDYKFGIYRNDLPYTQCDSTIEATRATYVNLPEGSYSVKVEDKCSVQSGSFILTEPARARITNAATVGVTDPTCLSPADGRIDSLELSGPDRFSYSVNGQPYSRQIWRNGIPAGTYTVDVLDADRPSCPGDRIVRTLTPPAPLQIGTVDLTGLHCFGIPEGEIEAGAGSGGSQSLQYMLYRLSDDTRITHPSNIFTGLQAGDYRLTLRNRNSWCADTAYRTVTIQTPPQLVATLASADVRCYGEASGSITHAVSGGTGDRSLQWQQRLGNDVWAPGTFNLSGLTPGEYRLSVTDANNCQVLSNTAVIGQPDELTGNALVSDIRCFGEKGRIGMSATGGNGGYLFLFDAGSGFAGFPADSLFGAGTYSVKVADSKGCETLIRSGIGITAPASPLAFTFTASNYNGFNISCFGNNDGRVDISATGGNGAAYSGYSYSMNALTQAGNPLFDRLTAGAYTVRVRDGRGCEAVQPLTVTQPDAGLTFAAPLIRDVTCYDHTDGSITLQPLGGTAPFAYRTGTGDFTPSALFDGLGAGEYDFTVRDANGCLWNQKFPVTSLVPKMEIGGTVSNVNCFGGNDGSIAISLAGGRAPVNYLWKETGAVTRDASALTVGSYTLLATDDAGCLTEKAFTVGQPKAPLALWASAKPVCVGVTRGYIRPGATAGTPPYLYAIDRAQDFAPQNEFTAAPGVHSVFARDANGCLTETSVEVEVKNSMPSVNFMAATLRYAMDTLVLKEVNVPKPDSVKWTLDPGMYMTGGDEFSPVVTTDSPGQYTVLMTGWFGGCDYTVEKLLQFSEYDPSAIPGASQGNGISSIELYPNPNTGEFKVKVGLSVKQQVLIRVMDITSREWFSKQYAPAETVEEYINITAAPPGVYVLMVVAEHDAKSIRVVKQ